MIVLKQSIGSKDKLRLKSEFAYMRESGDKIVGKYLLLVTAPAPDGKLRCGVICGKKYNKRAVKRNRARRLLWESFRMLKQRVKPVHMCLIVRHWMMDQKQPVVQKELEKLLRQAGILKESETQV